MYHKQFLAHVTWLSCLNCKHMMQIFVWPWGFSWMKSLHCPLLCEDVVIQQRSVFKMGYPSGWRWVLHPLHLSVMLRDAVWVSIENQLKVSPVWLTMSSVCHRTGSKQNPICCSVWWGQAVKPGFLTGGIQSWKTARKW